MIEIYARRDIAFNTTNAGNHETKQNFQLVSLEEAEKGLMSQPLSQW